MALTGLLAMFHGQGGPGEAGPLPICLAPPAGCPGGRAGPRTREAKAGTGCPASAVVELDISSPWGPGDRGRGAGAKSRPDTVLGGVPGPGQSLTSREIIFQGRPAGKVPPAGEDSKAPAIYLISRSGTTPCPSSGTWFYTINHSLRLSCLVPVTPTRAGMLSSHTAHGLTHSRPSINIC